YGTADVLKIVGKSVTGAIKYLNIQPQQKEKIQTYIRISSLIIRLTGLSPTARMVKKQLFEKKDEKSVTVEHKTLLRWHAILEQQLSEMKFRGVLSENALEEATIIRLVDGVIGELRFWEGLREIHSNASTSASVDSELTLILAGPYQRAGWLPNPFLRKYDAFPSIKEIRENTIMVGRLDGPTPELTKRMIDDAIETENIGLDGIFYIDARGLKDKGTHDSYWWYDQHLTNLYNIVKNDSSMRVIVDDKPDLFPPGACPNAALYCGWYSLANYIDAFKWQTGAVGFHVASAEARTLRRQGSNVWCKRMIEEGVAATLGPVEEPYLLSFPLPDIFFPLLMTGKLPILEVYFRSTPYLSWRQIFIGDPLYTPFQKNPAIDLTKVKKNE
ncbi:MAG: TIGR03790 family protein, partial [Thermodesulfobacteriota bacterium]|nr:TIGR03790 family protein [Thermodesulfobacteriota bacterium]